MGSRGHGRSGGTRAAAGGTTVRRRGSGGTGAAWAATGFASALALLSAALQKPAFAVASTFHNRSPLCARHFVTSLIAAPAAARLARSIEPRDARTTLAAGGSLRSAVVVDEIEVGRTVTGEGQAGVVVIVPALGRPGQRAQRPGAGARWRDRR